MPDPTSDEDLDRKAVAKFHEYDARVPDLCRTYLDCFVEGYRARATEEAAGKGELESLRARLAELEGQRNEYGQVDLKGEYAATVMALQNMGTDVTCGACMSVAFTGATEHQHTCSAAEHARERAELIATVRANRCACISDPDDASVSRDAFNEALDKLAAMLGVEVAGG